MAETEVKSINGRPVADVTARAKIEEIKNAAPGFVFDTVADMEAYIAQNAGTLKVGQDLFIRAADVPDFWWDGTAAVPVETELGKVQGKLTELSKAIENLPTGGGMSTTVKTLLMTILRNGVYTSDQSANINALETALGESGGTDNTETVTQIGSILRLVGGVTVTQSGTTLSVA